MVRLVAATSMIGLAVMMTAAGCGGTPAVKPPPTVAVTGTVLDKKGSPFPGGSIEFRHLKNPEFTSMGVINDDGSFTLKTIAGNASVEGAQEGEHNVTVTSKMGADQNVKSYQLKKPVNIKAGDTKLTIKLD